MSTPAVVGRKISFMVGSGFPWEERAYYFLVLEVLSRFIRKIQHRDG